MQVSPLRLHSVKSPVEMTKLWFTFELTTTAGSPTNLFVGVVEWDIRAEARTAPFSSFKLCDG